MAKRRKRVQQTPTTGSPAPPPAEMTRDDARADLIHATEVHHVRVTVAIRDLLTCVGIKVLPTNEFFNIADSDWSNQSPRSVVGQYVKALTDEQRQFLQDSIDDALGRPRGSRGTGYAYGHTVPVTMPGARILLTNTAKYDLEKVKSRLQTEQQKEAHLAPKQA